jgi:hypothetical protein
MLPASAVSVKKPVFFSTKIYNFFNPLLVNKYLVMAAWHAIGENECVAVVTT